MSTHTHAESTGLNVPACLSLLCRIPKVELNAVIQPVTYSILTVTANILPVFEWSDKWSGVSEPFLVWLEDPSNHSILHHEELVLKKNYVKEIPSCFLPGRMAGNHHRTGYTLRDKKKDQSDYEITVKFAVPLHDPRPPQYILTVASQRWVGVQASYIFELEHLLLPHARSAHTDLLPLDPLPVQVLNDERYQSLYPFQYFNPIQTQVFHPLFHSDVNVLLGAPTGSGKTICAEFAMFRLFNSAPSLKVIYIAPLKALAKERLQDWVERLQNGLRKTVVELSGDFSPDIQALQKADVIITTPEKWDGISRYWQHRSYVRHVGLVVIDEIHLLGQDRGPVLEIIVSRMRYIAGISGTNVRFVGLSTALANATDIADWLGVQRHGLYNFRPAVRPVPCTVHISGKSIPYMDRIKLSPRIC